MLRLVEITKINKPLGELLLSSRSKQDDRASVKDLRDLLERALALAEREYAGMDSKAATRLKELQRMLEEERSKRREVRQTTRPCSHPSCRRA